MFICGMWKKIREGPMHKRRTMVVRCDLDHKHTGQHEDSVNNDWTVEATNSTDTIPVAGGTPWSEVPRDTYASAIKVVFKNGEYVGERLGLMKTVILKQNLLMNGI